MQATFPLEIRGMIYDHLGSDMYDKHHYAIQAVMSAVPPEIGHCRCLTHGHGLPRVPHYLFEEYVGRKTAQEIVGTLYRSNWFAEQTVYTLTTDLVNIIRKDAFGAGFDPATCIRDLDVGCLVDAYRQTPLLCCGSQECQHTPYDRRYIDQGRLRSDFEHLLAIVRNKDLRHLEVTFIQRNVRVDVLEEALEAFAKIYQAFKNAGIDMRIRWGYSAVLCDGLHGHERNLAKFFSDPRSTWKQRMRRFLEGVSTFWPEQFNC
jgi:hypothetical protein